MCFYLLSIVMKTFGDLDSEDCLGGIQRGQTQTSLSVYNVKYLLLWDTELFRFFAEKIFHVNNCHQLPNKTGY